MAKAVPLLLLLVLALPPGCAPAPTSSASPLGASMTTGAAPQTGAFAPERWFAGRTVGRGEFRRTIGGVQSRFDMVILGQWDGRVLTMDETFISKEGRWNRVWTITKLADGAYEGQLTTGRGPATITARGDTIRMRYAAAAPLLERPFNVRFDQTLQLQADGTVLNVADVYKWGLRIGRSTVVFRKTDDVKEQG